MARGVRIGDALLINTPGTPHLYVAIAEFPDDDEYLFVNLTTLRPNSERCCILRPGPDLPRFVKHESAIAYRHARKVSIALFLGQVVPGSQVPYDTFPMHAVQQIQQGGLQSRLLNRGYKRALKGYLDGLT